MIETSLLIIISCDKCENQVETESALDGAGNPDIDIFEGRAWTETEADGWTEQDEQHLCPDCSRRAADR